MTMVPESGLPELNRWVIFEDQYGLWVMVVEDVIPFICGDPQNPDCGCLARQGGHVVVGTDSGGYQHSFAYPTYPWKYVGRVDQSNEEGPGTDDG